MRRTWSLGIRGRLLAAFLGVLLPYLALAGLGVVAFWIVWQWVGTIQKEAVVEMKSAADLQVAVVRLVMPANDYLLTGDPAERGEFEWRLAGTREALARLEQAHLMHPEERRALGEVRGRLGAIETISREILAVPDPRRGPSLIGAMKELDRAGDEVTATLNRFRQANEREIEEESEQAVVLVRRVSGLGLGLLVLSVGGGVGLALVIAAWLSRPILAIAETSRRMAEGDLSRRVAAHAGGELGEAARAFNEMAERLAGSAVENARLYEEVEAERIRLTLVMESASDAIIIADSAGHIVSWNSGAQTLLGYTPDQILGKPADTLMPERYRESHRAGLERLGSTGVARVIGRAIEVTGLRRDGSEVPLELSLAGWTTKQGTFYSGIARDVTERKQVEQMKSDFVSFVTHQLRTPLAGIKWMLELAQEAPDVPEEPASYVQDARQAAERLIGLVNDLLDVSRLESGKLKVTLQPVGLGELTQSVLDDLVTLVREKGHRLSMEGAERVPAVMADPQLLRQVILNLTSNAIKYTPPGGDVAIRMEVANGAVRWAIRDSGIGIPKESRARLFEKFFRADNVHTISTEGTGLGLYLVRLILEKFSGEVWCESEEGKGSTFIFTLPVAG